MSRPPVTVAWISYFPVEWLEGVPEEVRRLPRMHPASWQRVLLEELAGNPAVRLHVVVLRKQFARDLTFTRNGIVFHLLKIPAGLRATTLFWVDTILVKRKLAEIQPEVVHAWGSEQGAALVATRLGRPYVATVQGLLTWCRELVPLNRYQRFAALLEGWSLPRAPVLTTEAAFVAQYIQQRWPRANVRQVEHAPDWLFHRVVRQPQLQPRRFLYVGALSHPKGADVLLAALDQLKAELDFDLLIVGGGEREYLERLRRQTSGELWQRIQFKQELRPAEIADELARAALLIFPTRADTSPNSVKEAAVAGVPVAASAMGGIPEYIFPSRNGILFTPGSPPACAAAIRAACAHPLLGQGRVEAQALSEVRDYLSPRRMAASFLQIYQSLADARRDSTGSTGGV